MVKELVLSQLLSILFVWPLCTYTVIGTWKKCFIPSQTQSRGDQTITQKLINLILLMNNNAIWNGMRYVPVLCTVNHHCTRKGRQGIEKVDFSEKTIAARALWPSIWLFTCNMPHIPLAIRQNFKTVQPVKKRQNTEGRTINNIFRCYTHLTILEISTDDIVPLPLRYFLLYKLSIWLVFSTSWFYVNVRSIY